MSEWQRNQNKTSIVSSYRGDNKYQATALPIYQIVSFLFYCFLYVIPKISFYIFLGEHREEEENTNLLEFYNVAYKKEEATKKTYLLMEYLYTRIALRRFYKMVFCSSYEQ